MRTTIARFAILSALLAGLPTALPSPAIAQPTEVQAGGQSCIAYRFVRVVSGVYDSSYVEYTNRCSSTVGFFYCQSTVYQQATPPACNAQTGTYNTANAAAGWTSRYSASASGNTVVVIRECPTGYRPYSKVNGIFYCRR